MGRSRRENMLRKNKATKQERKRAEAERRNEILRKQLRRERLTSGMPGNVGNVFLMAKLAGLR